MIWTRAPSGISNCMPLGSVMGLMLRSVALNSANGGVFVNLSGSIHRGPLCYPGCRDDEDHAARAHTKRAELTSSLRRLPLNKRINKRIDVYPHTLP